MGWTSDKLINGRPVYSISLKSELETRFPKRAGWYIVKFPQVATICITYMNGDFEEYSSILVEPVGILSFEDVNFHIRKDKQLPYFYIGNNEYKLSCTGFNAEVVFEVGIQNGEEESRQDPANANATAGVD